MKRIVRSAIVGHSAQQMFRLVEDIESYPSFIPLCVRASVHERTPGRTLATLEIGYKGVRKALTTENLNIPGKSIEMALVRGPFRSFRARWYFRALDETAARIEFEVEYDFSSTALERLLGPLFDNLAATMVDVFTRRAETLGA